RTVAAVVAVVRVPVFLVADRIVGVAIACVLAALFKPLLIAVVVGDVVDTVVVIAIAAVVVGAVVVGAVAVTAVRIRGIRVRVVVSVNAVVAVIARVAAVDHARIVGARCNPFSFVAAG